MNIRQSYKLVALAGLLSCSTGAWAQPVITDGAQAGNGSNNTPAPTQMTVGMRELRNGRGSRLLVHEKRKSWNLLLTAHTFRE